MKSFRTASDVFFRLYGENTIVYKTTSRKVAVMNDVCFEILSFFSEYKNSGDFFSYVSEKYNSKVTKEYQEAIEDFLNNLLEMGFLETEFEVYEQKYGLDSVIAHSNIIPQGTLMNVMFELTYRCNERCRHCYCVNPDIKRELSTEKIKALIDELYQMNVSELTFTGGDLFVRQDTFEILDYAYKKKFLVNIFTNGTLLKDEDFYHLQSLHLKSISFSIYSNIASKHDYFTQLPGSFEKTITAAKKCIALGIPVNIKSSIVEFNKDDVSGIIELDKSIGAYPQISMAITPRNNGDMSSTTLRMNDVEVYKQTLKTANSYIEKEQFVEYKDIVRKEDRICWAGVNNLSINPYGEVFACNALLIKCGDVNYQTIEDIWKNSKELNKIRSFNMGMLQGCEECHIKHLCSFCLGSAYGEHKNPLKRYYEACCIAQAKEELRKEEKQDEITND